jgi:IS30 family transposase
MRLARRKLTVTERDQLWQRWRSGESLTEVAQALGRKPGSIYGFLAQSGGIAPARRRRRALQLSVSEREEISRALGRGDSLRSIAALLRRAPSTISREIRRNGGSTQYRAAAAEELAWERALRPKVCKLAAHPHLCRVVATKLQLEWSP